LTGHNQAVGWDGLGDATTLPQIRALLCCRGFARYQ